MNVQWSKWVPTRKWFAAFVGLYTPIALQAIDTGWDKTETREAVIALSGLALAYITGNAPNTTVKK